MRREPGLSSSGWPSVLLFCVALFAVMTTARSLGIVGPDSETPDDTPVALVLPVAVDAATELPSIMLVGDSITQGSGGAYTWRYFLYQYLAASYGPGDYFVGPYQAPFQASSDDYAVPTGWDQDHASLSGRMISCYLDGAAGDGLCTDPDRASEDLQNFDPDVVVVLLGTNDVLLPWGRSTPDEFYSDIGQLVATGRANNPTVSFLLVGVPPVAGAEVRAAQLNAGLESLAERLNSPTSLVAYTPAGVGFDHTLDTEDGIHPNVLGDQIIAANIATGLAEHFGIR